MKRFVVLISDRAEHDLAEIADYIGRGSPRNALRFVRRVRRIIAKLKVMPSRFRGAPEGVLQGHVVRQVLVGAYRVLFTIGDDNVVRIHGVRHAARRPIE